MSDLVYICYSERRIQIKQQMLQVIRLRRIKRERSSRRADILRFIERQTAKQNTV